MRCLGFLLEELLLVVKVVQVVFPYSASSNGRTLFGGVEDDGGRPQREERLVVDDASLAIPQQFRADEGARITRSVAQDILEFSVLVPRDIDMAVRQIHTRVHRLYRTVDRVASWQKECRLPIFVER